MIDSGQLLERFRLLSRDIQNGLQSSQRQLDSIRKNPQNDEINRLARNLDDISEAWQDFSGWILVSTIEDPEAARANCAPGRIDIVSKVSRSKIRRKNDLSRNGIKVDSSGVEPLVIETFIPYFEQLLDLIFNNAIKYSPRGGMVEVSSSRFEKGVTISIKSVGPNVAKSEISSLGLQGFRSENARKMQLSGQGYGLFNCLRIASLLGVRVEFQPDSKILFELSKIEYSNFNVHLHIPEDAPSMQN